MAKVSASILINKPIRKVFEYTASPINGPAFIPNLSENANMHPKKPCLGQTFDWRFTMTGIDLKGKAVVTEFDPPHKTTITTSGDSKATWIYTFQKENGGTRVTIEVKYEIAENMLKKIANKLIINKLNQRTAEQMLNNLKTILEG